MSVQGSVPPVKVFAEHAYLLPLGDMRLENLDPRAQEMPKLAVPYLAMPMSSWLCKLECVKEKSWA